MRWADVSIRFVRPIHWILALFGGEVIPFEVGNVRSGNVTYGHRFMHAGPIRVNNLRNICSKTQEDYNDGRSGRAKKKIEEEMAKQAGAGEGLGEGLRDEELLMKWRFWLNILSPCVEASTPSFFLFLKMSSSTP